MRTKGACLEEEPVATIEERVEDGREALVLRDVVLVAPHLGHDHPLGMAVPAAGGHVDVPVVEEHPGLRRLGGLRSRPRLLLDEAVDGRRDLVDGVVEAAVQGDGLLDAHCTDRGLSVVVTRDGLGREGSRHDRPADLCVASTNARQPACNKTEDEQACGQGAGHVHGPR